MYEYVSYVYWSIIVHGSVTKLRQGSAPAPPSLPSMMPMVSSATTAVIQPTVSPGQRIHPGGWYRFKFANQKKKSIGFWVFPIVLPSWNFIYRFLDVSSTYTVEVTQEAG